ncbi:MAG: hypothetical protein AABW54_04985 [Candidatus Micrarchaeota archaeon]
MPQAKCVAKTKRVAGLTRLGGKVTVPPPSELGIRPARDGKWYVTHGHGGSLVTHTLPDLRHVARQAIHTGEEIRSRYTANTRLMLLAHRIHATLPSLEKGSQPQQREEFARMLEEAEMHATRAAREVRHRLLGYLPPQVEAERALQQARATARSIAAWRRKEKRAGLNDAERDALQAGERKKAALEKESREKAAAAKFVAQGGVEKLRAKFDATISTGRARITAAEEKAKAHAAKAEAATRRGGNPEHWQGLQAKQEARARKLQEELTGKARGLRAEMEKYRGVRRVKGAIELVREGNWPAARKSLAPERVKQLLAAENESLRLQQRRFSNIECWARARMKEEDEALAAAVNTLRREQAYFDKTSGRTLTGNEARILSQQTFERAAKLEVLGPQAADAVKTLQALAARSTSGVHSNQVRPQLAQAVEMLEKLLKLRGANR